MTPLNYVVSCYDRHLRCGYHRELEGDDRKKYADYVKTRIMKGANIFIQEFLTNFNTHLNNEEISAILDNITLTSLDTYRSEVVSLFYKCHAHLSSRKKREILSLDYGYVNDQTHKYINECFSSLYRSLSIEEIRFVLARQINHETNRYSYMYLDRGLRVEAVCTYLDKYAYFIDVTRSSNRLLPLIKDNIKLNKFTISEVDLAILGRGLKAEIIDMMPLISDLAGVVISYL